MIFLLQFDVFEGLFISVFSIVVVYLILYVVTLSVMPLKHIKERSIPLPQVIATTKPFSLEDITDEDMMVAAIIASIDYQSITKTDVHVKSIREIK